MGWHSLSKLKEIIDYEGLYSITKNGKIWRHKKIIQGGNQHGSFDLEYGGHWMSVWINGSGYKAVKFCKNGNEMNHLVHRLLGKTFIDNPYNKLEINHKDGNKLNNSLDNIEWVTHQENSIHAYKLGLMYKFKPQIGEEHWNSKLTWDIVKEIRETYPYKKRGERVWIKYGISKMQYYDIVNNKYWVDINYQKSKPHYKLSNKQVSEIRKLVKTKKYKQKEIAKMYNISTATCSLYVNNKLRKEAN